MTQPRDSGDFVQQVIDRLPPSTWDAAVWLESQNYVTGRIDSADVRRIVTTILTVADLREVFLSDRSEEASDGR